MILILLMDGAPKWDWTPHGLGGFRELPLG